MIIPEPVTIDGIDYIHRYSDSGRYLVGGEPYGVYTDAYDLVGFERTYTEGDVMPPDESDLADKAEAYDILMGVSE